MFTTESIELENRNASATYSPRFTTDLREYMEEGDTAVGLALALAEASECDPLDLTPLRDGIDPDALDSMFESGSSALVVEFETNGWGVSLSGSGSAVFYRPHE